MNEGPRTTFRDALIGELRSFTDAVDISETTVQGQFVEDKREMIGEFLDYYTDELLKFAPFVEEFSARELGAIHAFVRCLGGFSKDIVDWRRAQSEAANLLSTLIDE